MSDLMNVSAFVTRGFEFSKADDDKRIFKGHITAEVVDRQGEYIAVEEVMKIMKNYMDTMPAVSEIHSNRMVGKVDAYKKSEIDGHPSVYVEGHIFKQDGVTLYDNVWNMVKTGVYKGLSMGGSSKIKTPIFKDGRVAIELKKIELYEIALCPLPANQLAIIDYVNPFAKAAGMEDKIKKSEDGREYIQCDSILCTIEKAQIGSEASTPGGAEAMGNEMQKCGNCGGDFNKCGTCGASKMTKSTEFFNKPFAGYENFEACVKANSDKGDAKAYCATIMRQVEDGEVKKEQDTQSIKDEKLKETKELADKKDREIVSNVADNVKDSSELIKTMQKVVLKNTLI